MPGASFFPFIVSTVAWVSRSGQWNLTVCLKATFALASADEPPLASAQDGPHEDVLYDQAAHASLYSPSDFAPFKPRADILLVGHAHAPAGAAVDALTVRLTLGDFSKALRITGDRTWVDTPQGPRASLPRPFTHLPLRYERASRRGENLVGAVPGDASRPPPNIEVAAPEGLAETPGFGPVAPSWRALRDSRTHEALLWAQRLRTAPAPAPAGLDPGAFNAAPGDQQVDEIRPATPLLLENLHARSPRLATRLPALVPTVFHRDPAGQPRAVSMRLDTLWIDTDREVFVLSWRGITGIPAPGVLGVGQVMAAAHPPGHTVGFDEVEALQRGGTSRRRPPATVAFAMPPAESAATPLPFVAQAAPAATGSAQSAPIAGAPWASVSAVPAPRLNQFLASTLPLGESPFHGLVPAPSTPGAAARAPQKAQATIGREVSPPDVAPAPLFSVAALPPEGGAAAGAAAPIAGAPWSAAPAAPVPKLGLRFQGTLSLGNDFADAVATANAATARGTAPAVVAQPPMVVPPPIAALPVVAAPPVSPEVPPPPLAVPPSLAAPPDPVRVVWRVDSPEPGAPAARTPPLPPPAAIENKVYGDFTRRKR